MSPRRVPKDIGASVRARLLNLAKSRGVGFELVLSEFAIERLLYRLGRSPHAEEFVLKGATLFRMWTTEAGRATWDLDLLGRGDTSIDSLKRSVERICAVEAADGITYNGDAVSAQRIRAADQDGGVRLKLTASLSGARVPVQIDIGFGDVVVPSPRKQDFPALLALEPAHIYVYPKEAVVAEKLNTVVSLGVMNSRMKDFYDLWFLASCFAFDGTALVAAIRATFNGRSTTYPSGLPLALQPGFLSVPQRAVQWRAFLRKGRLVAPIEVAALIKLLRAFVEAPLASAAGAGTTPCCWLPGGPWTDEGQDCRQP